MGRMLVVVESNEKARTLTRLLGEGFRVVSSGGPARRACDRHAISVERGFEVAYEVPASRQRALRELHGAFVAADAGFLAFDPDDAGEEAAWHLVEALALAEPLRRRILRACPLALTREAVETAFATARPLDGHVVEAREARFVLDRLVDEGLDRCLTRAFEPGLGLGRLQATALLLLADRERAAHRLRPQEAWWIEARFAETGEDLAFTCEATGGLSGRVDVEALCERLRRGIFRVLACTEAQVSRPTAAPFVTSTLLQEASRELGFGVRRTWRLAQQLYEGVSSATGSSGQGLITFYRTQGAPLAEEMACAASACADHAAHLEPGTPGLGTSRRDTRAGAEAIRPTHVTCTPEALGSVLGGDLLSLYGLIHRRALASRMSPTVCTQTALSLVVHLPGAETEPRTLVFRSEAPASGSRGHLSFEDTGRRGGAGPRNQAERGPALDVAQRLTPLRITAVPPRRSARLTEADFVAELERCGIAKPAILADLTAVLSARPLVRRDGEELRLTGKGATVAAWLEERLAQTFSPARAAAVEDRLRAIAEGRNGRLATLVELWREHEPVLRAACGGRRPGAAPKPAAARDSGARDAVSCPGCHVGRVVLREAHGRRFFACDRFPDCRFTSKHRPVAESCPRCGRAYLLEKETARGLVRFCADDHCRRGRGARND